MSHILSKFLGILLSLAVLSAFLFFAAANREPLGVDLSPLTDAPLELPKFLWLLLILIAGMVIGALYFVLDLIKTRLRLKQQQKRAEALANEVAALRVEQAHRAQVTHYLPPPS